MKFSEYYQDAYYNILFNDIMHMTEELYLNEETKNEILTAIKTIDPVFFTNARYPMTMVVRKPFEYASSMMGATLRFRNVTSITDVTVDNSFAIYNCEVHTGAEDHRIKDFDIDKFSICIYHIEEPHGDVMFIVVYIPEK